MNTLERNILVTILIIFAGMLLETIWNDSMGVGTLTIVGIVLTIYNIATWLLAPEDDLDDLEHNRKVYNEYFRQKQKFYNDKITKWEKLTKKDLV